MNIYAVIKHVPYEGGYSIKHFAKEADANHYSDWCNAIEHDRILSVAKKYKYKDNWIQHTFRDTYEVEEFEVF